MTDSAGSVALAATQGHLRALQAMRDKLAADMDAAPPAVVAQIAGQLRILLAELATLEAAAPKESTSDDIARELAAGLAGAKVVQLAGRGGKRRSG